MEEAENQETSWEASSIELVSPVLSTADEGNGTPVIFVSLYLLLLAFFIFLHSISVLKEERIRSVLGSVNIAFQGLSQETPADRQKSLSGEEQGTQEFQAKLLNVFETAVPLVESHTTDGGTRLQFDVPVDRIFEKDSDQLNGGMAGFLTDVAAALIQRNSNVATDLEIMIGTGPSLPSTEEIADNLANKRVGRLIEKMLAFGVPSRNLSVALEEGDAGLLHFSFFLRPGLTFRFRPEEGQ
ncbi:MAG: hypothetical protein EP348_04200 [Alphaproteobacteria bacterium]|nr:MAG: hypothetical protein EP348_04200 [Alphaproteobacteria bacterium]